MFFKDITGQDEIKQRLLNSVHTGQIAHAQLICGPSGIGKFPMAMAYARYIHCTDRSATDACGKCPSCRQYSALTHPDLHFVFPIVRNEKKKKKFCDDYNNEWCSFLKEHVYFGIDDWLSYIGSENSQAIIYSDESERILHKMSMKTYESPYKIMIIWMPERMHQTCANKLLKLLEEPYENTVFLLVCDEPAKLLGTIQSRAQRVTMKALPDAVIAGSLQLKFGLDRQNALSVAHLAEGNYVRACENLMLNEESGTYFDFFVRIMRLAYMRKIKDLKLWSEDVSDLGRERIRKYLFYMQRMIRENYIYNLQNPHLNFMNKDEEAFSSRFAPFVHERNVLSIMKCLEDAEKDIGQNANAKIVLFDLSIKMIMLLKN